MKNDVDFSLLFAKYLENRCSADEADQLLRCLKKQQYREEAMLLITQQIKEPVQDIADEAVKKKLQERLQYILEETEQSSFIRPAHRIHYNRTAWFRWTSAAAIIILFGSGAYLWNQHSTNKSTADVSAEARSAKEDIAPGGSRAILTLADGTTIILDSAANGTLAQEGNTTVTKQNDQIIYGYADPLLGGVGVGLAPQTFNTMTTPRGGQYQLILPDGSRVWLNAASSITYPTAFTGKERHVRITGEVYFEVAKDPKKKFVVTSGELTTEVLGTHFNVNAYHDNRDKRVKTTLLEGSIKVLAHGNSKIIKPGQQASASFSGTQVEISDKVDLEKIMAWKNGKISLTNSSVEQVMQDISRWYDVDIKYNGAMPSKQFYGSIHRNVPLSSVLNALKAYGVNTKLEGKTIIVE